ncbi:hypothetical protein ACLBXM_17865 [Xanthobacteraceae bacterium A53D]
MIPHLEHLSTMASQARIDAQATANQLERSGIGKGFGLQRTPDQMVRAREILANQEMIAEFIEWLADRPVEARAALLSICEGRAA